MNEKLIMDARILAGEYASFVADMMNRSVYGGKLDVCRVFWSPELWGLSDGSDRIMIDIEHHESCEKLSIFGQDVYFIGSDDEVTVNFKSWLITRSDDINHVVNKWMISETIKNLGINESGFQVQPLFAFDVCALYQYIFIGQWVVVCKTHGVYVRLTKERIWLTIDQWVAKHFAANKVADILRKNGITCKTESEYSQENKSTFDNGDRVKILFSQQIVGHQKELPGGVWLHCESEELLRHCTSLLVYHHRVRIEKLARRMSDLTGIPVTATVCNFGNSPIAKGLVYLTHRNNEIPAQACVSYVFGDMVMVAENYEVLSMIENRISEE